MPYLFLHHQNPSKYGLWHLFFKNWRCTCGQRRMLTGAGPSCSGSDLVAVPPSQHIPSATQVSLSLKRGQSARSGVLILLHTQRPLGEQAERQGSDSPDNYHIHNSFTVSEVLMEPLKPFYAALTIWTSDTYRIDAHAHVNFQDWMFSLQGYETV